MEFPVFQFVPINSHPATQRSVWFHLLYSPYQYVFTYIDKQSQVSQSLLIGQIYQPLNHPCGPLLHSLQCVHVFLAFEEPQNWTQCSRCVPPNLSREEGQ